MELSSSQRGEFEGAPLFILRGKTGRLYAQWGNKRRSLACFGGRPVENITRDQLLHILIGRRNNRH